MLIRLPSGAETKVSVRMLSPLKDATSSLSMASNIAFCASAAALASGVFSAASNSSRLATSLAGPISGMDPKIALIRGSMRGSERILEAMGAFPCRWLFRSSLREAGGSVTGEGARATEAWSPT